MKLYRLLERLTYQLLCGEIDCNVTEVIHNSAMVTEGAMFVCIVGNKADGHDYVSQVIKQGAKVIVAEKRVKVPEDVTLILVDNSRIALSYIAAAYYGYPAEKLYTIGITGTKGKTTTSYMIRAILEEAGIKTGLIGTIEVCTGSKTAETQNTTPDPLLLQQYLSEMLEDGCRAVVMEVSSQGLMLNRVASMVFDYGIFTNLAPDHIGKGEHSSYEEYRACKAKLFQQCKVGIVNGDCEELPYILEGHTCSVETYGLVDTWMIYGNCPSLLQRPDALGIQFYVRGCMSTCVELWMPGMFNIYNALAAISVARHFDIPEEEIRRALSNVRVRGRLEILKVSDCFTTMIDYAHNAVSLRKLLKTIKEYRPKRVVCLFGCGGNRAKRRRYEMGQEAAKLADLVVVTSDNPREEEMDQIIDDIVVGIETITKNYVRITDRVEAIQYCLQQARQGDVIILAGKGHETYQEIKGIKYHMDEREIIADFLEKMSVYNIE